MLLDDDFEFTDKELSQEYASQLHKLVSAFRVFKQTMMELFPKDYDDMDFKEDVSLISNQTNVRYKGEVIKLAKFKTDDEKLVQHKILKIRIF